MLQSIISFNRYRANINYAGSLLRVSASYRRGERSDAATGRSNAAATVRPLQRGELSKDTVTEQDLALHALRDNDGARRQRKRVGRGRGSGHGKTCGKGHKGQRARSGRPRPGFEGGQFPAYLKVRKYGFTNAKFKTRYAEINVGTVQRLVDQGRLDATAPITIKSLVDAGAIKANRIGDGVKLLSKGRETLTAPLTIEVSRASASARDAIEQAGGAVHQVFFNTLGLRALVKPYKFEGRILPRFCSVPPHAVARGQVHPSTVPSYAESVHGKLYKDQDEVPKVFIVER